jgi:3'-phosphoadenosine 5'-phosphosulfate sulfotransferase (PAPS reductase)/FAD synthetase
VAPIRRFLQGTDGQKVIFDGIRAAESSARSKYTPVWYHPSFKCLSVSPIFYWSDEKVAGYIESSGLPRSPAEKLGTSAECWCGAYQGRADFEALLSIHPEIFQKLVDVERAQKGKYTFVYEKGKNIRLETIRRSVATNGSGKSRS